MLQRLLHAPETSLAGQRFPHASLTLLEHDNVPCAASVPMALPARFRNRGMQADEVCQECAGVLPHGCSALPVERCSSNRMESRRVMLCTKDIINASQTLPGCVQGSRMQVLAALAINAGRRAIPDRMPTGTAQSVSSRSAALHPGYHKRSSNAPLTLL